MDVKALQAAQAYAQTAKPSSTGEAAALSGPGGAAGGADSFADLLKGAVEQTGRTTLGGEQAILKGASGQAELVDVVTAVANAELALETVVAVRDRVIQAYQDIMRMPI